MHLRGSQSEWRDASGTVQLCEVSLHHEWFGLPALLIEAATGARVAFITRLGDGLIPNGNTVLQEGDLVHLTLLETDRTKVDEILSRAPEVN